jgi:AraC-like DNA-binding protein
MIKAPAELTDVTVHSPHTQSHGVKALNVESRPWIESFPTCPILNQYQILHLGVQKTAAPTRIVRTNQTTSYFLACIKGKGRVLIDGSWRICREGYACFLPAYTLNAFEALPGNKWEFCWVCYLRPVDQRPISDVIAPVMARFDALPLQSAITGLIYECRGPNQPTLMQEWTDLINAYVLRFIKPSDQPDQLRLLWERVSAQLSDQWNLAKLAREAGYSNEHLRRLCRRQLGRSPMHQVTYLRMRRAAELLATTEQTIESISHEIGYQNPFVFSNAFTKWIGWRPSEYRRKKLKSEASSG